jgi:hypothetical protein
MRSLGLLTALLVASLLSGCGEDASSPNGKSGQPDAGTSSLFGAADEFTVAGKVKVDDLGAVDFKRNPDRCELTGEIGRILNVGLKPVVITDPEGREVALAEITEAVPPTYVDKDDGKEYYAPGFCNLTFQAFGVQGQDGVFTASVPGLGIETRFEASDATDLVLKYDR